MNGYMDGHMGKKQGNWEVFGKRVTMRISYFFIF